MFLKAAMPAPDITSPSSATINQALPKVNVPPVINVEEKTPSNGHASPDTKVSFINTEKRSGFAWDFKFSLGLIILVITVNMALALLLGKTGDLKNSAAVQMFADPQERNIPLQASPAELQQIAPAAGSVGEKTQTRTYISPEEKRLLLKYLETPAERRAAIPTTAATPNIDR